MNPFSAGGLVIILFIVIGSIVAYSGSSQTGLIIAGAGLLIGLTIIGIAFWRYMRSD